MNKFRILIVDDSSVRKAIIRILKANDPEEKYQFLGVDMGGVDLGEEALALLNTEVVHLLITGRDLPAMKGFELIAAFQEKSPNTKIILFASTEGNIPTGVTLVRKPYTQSLALEVRRIGRAIPG